MNYTPLWQTGIGFDIVRDESDGKVSKAPPPSEAKAVPTVAKGSDGKKSEFEMSFGERMQQSEARNKAKPGAVAVEKSLTVAGVYIIIPFFLQTAQMLYL